MWIIYGTRAYGRVGAHGGEHAETRFMHIYYVPLIPLGSTWITGDNGGSKVGYSIGLNAKSTLAGYLRVWGPVLALMFLAAGIEGNPIMLPIAALSIAATVWSWTWRSLRGEAATRRSDFNLVAFGTRCEPRHMPKDLRARFKEVLDNRWNALKPDRSPNEIAQHGTKDANEAVVAYGLLRLAGVMRGRAGRDEDRDADRILDGAHSTLAVGDGPYREGVQQQATGSLAHVVKAMAAESDQLDTTPVTARREINAKRKRSSRKQLIALVLATPIALFCVGVFARSVMPTKDVTLAELRGSHAPTSRTVRVTCDSIEGPLWEETDNRGNATNRIAMCVLGHYVLPLRFDDESHIPTQVVEGELRTIRESFIWVEQGLRRDPELDARSLEVFIDASDPHARIFNGIFALGIALSVPVLWMFWFRARRRRQAEAAALAAT